MPFLEGVGSEYRWKKGVSGNPGGQPKIFRELRKCAREDLPAVYAMLRAKALEEKDVSAARLIVQISGLPISRPMSTDEEDVETIRLTESELAEAEKLAREAEGNGLEN